MNKMLKELWETIGEIIVLVLTIAAIIGAFAAINWMCNTLL